MVAKQTSGIDFSEAPVRVSEWRRFRRVFFERKLVMVGLAVLLLLVLTAAFAPLLAPYDPYQSNMADSLHPVANICWALIFRAGTR
jgi:ABC-type antimicrobial peptide transport system permease subunit